MSDYNESDEYTELVKSIGETASNLSKQAYAIYRCEVNNIVTSKSKDIKEIERVLDGILGFCFDPKMLELFKELCRYYFYIDKQAVAEYVNF